MSILNDNQVIELTNAQIAAKNLIDQTRHTFNVMVNAFNIGSRHFWNNPNSSASEIAEALGPNAREVFELHYALGQLIGSVKPESIQIGLSVVGQFTMNEDGTVTIIESNSTTTTEAPINQ